jgi:hypothetical protein
MIDRDNALRLMPTLRPGKGYCCRPRAGACEKIDRDASV